MDEGHLVPGQSEAGATGDLAGEPPGLGEGEDDEVGVPCGGDGVAALEGDAEGAWSPRTVSSGSGSPAASAEPAQKREPMPLAAAARASSASKRETI